MREYVVTFGITTILLTSIVVAGLAAAPAYAGVPPEEILKCYASPLGGSGLDTQVVIEDQFGTQTVNSGGNSGSLCELGLKHATQLPAGFASRHWIIYGTDGASNFPLLTLTDQFGTQRAGSSFFNIFGLLVPALKDGQGDISNTAPHWTLHNIVVAPPGNKPGAVQVVDQFGPSTVVLDDAASGLFIGLLVPALKDGNGDLGAPHWTCYDIISETPPIDPPSHDYTDQFNTLTIDYRSAQTVCVKTIKQHEGPSVGGEILPVDTSAMLVAGVFTNAYWIIPTLGGIAGAALTVAKIKRRMKK